MNSCNRLKFAARLARTLLRDRRSPVQPRHAGRAFFFPEVLVLVAWLAGAAWPAVQADAPITMRVLQLENGQLRVEWDGGQPPYRVQACTENSYGWVDISDYIFGYSYTGPAPGDYACLRVRTAPDFQPPFPPEDLTVHAVRCDRVALGWDQARDDADGVGVLGYRLYRDGVLIIELADPATFFLDRHVLPSKSYSYTVTSFDWLGNESARSPAVLISTPPCLGESGPGREVTLMWDPSDERQVEGYLVYWGMRPGEYLWAIDAMDLTSIALSDLLPGVTYFFAVTAYNREGEQSDFSSPAAFITPDPYTGNGGADDSSEEQP